MSAILRRVMSGFARRAAQEAERRSG
jgi:hypothetical protein